MFFSRADRLNDDFEGSLTEHLLDPTVEEKATDEEKQKLKELRKQWGWLYRAQRKETVINCWHMNEYESAAMWKLHLKSEEGVAVQSTYKRLVESFNDYKENDVWIGIVNYIDYKKDTIPLQNTFFPFTYKRKSFEHERELSGYKQNGNIRTQPRILGYS